MNETNQSFKFSFSGSTLKLIAIITMLIDHIACFLGGLDFFQLELFRAGDISITFYYLFRTIGRTAFPIFCYMIGEGYLHTKNRFRYGLTLFIGAVVSEIPFNLVFSGRFYCKEHQNVFITLFLGYLGICCYERFRERRAIQLLTIIGLAAVTYIIHPDYSISGYGVILLFYILRMDRLAIGIIGSLILGLRSLPAYILLAFYNGKRGWIKKPALKYAFYAFYPVHLLVLYILQCALDIW